MSTESISIAGCFKGKTHDEWITSFNNEPKLHIPFESEKYSISYNIETWNKTPIKCSITVDKITPSCDDNTTKQSVPEHSVPEHSVPECSVLYAKCGCDRNFTPSNNLVNTNVNDVQTQTQTHAQTREQLLLDEKWSALEKMCIDSPQIFINMLRFIDKRALNHSKLTSEGPKTLFGVAVMNENLELVKHMLSCDLFEGQMLNKFHRGTNLFMHACSTNVDIAFQMLYSDKISPPIINDFILCYPYIHPIAQLFSSIRTSSKHSDKTEYIKRAIDADKFLKGCSEDEKLHVGKYFLSPRASRDIIYACLNTNKFTSELVEELRYGTKTIIEKYCIHGDDELLKMLLDSNKVTEEWACSVYPKLDISSYNGSIRKILNSHEKFANSIDFQCDKLEFANNNLRWECSNVKKHIDQLTARLNSNQI